MRAATGSLHLSEQRSVLTLIRRFLLVAEVWKECDAQSKCSNFSANPPQSSPIVPHDPNKIRELQTAAQTRCLTPTSAVRLQHDWRAKCIEICVCFLEND